MKPSLADLTAWDVQHVWHAFTQMAEYEPLFIERAAGCWLYDIHGNKYLDGVSSLWCNVHGHNHAYINQAIRNQLEKVAHVTSLGLSNSTTTQLAKKLVDRTNGHWQHLFFSDSGATAVEVALKMAFQYWRQCTPAEPQRNKFIAFEAAYHGDTLGSVSVSGVARFHAMFKPLLFNPIRLPLPQVTDNSLAAQLCGEILTQLEQCLLQHAHEVAALIMEPLVQCAAGMVMHPPGLLRGIRELTHRYNVLMIADEVAVGMGRTGTFLACEQEQVLPDFVCLAKGLSGGYLPVAATLTTTEIWNAFLGTYEDSRTFFHGHTYGGNALGCAAALATLEVFQQEATLEHLPEKIGRIKQHLTNLSQRKYVGNTRQCGMLAAFELMDTATEQAFPWQAKKGLAVCKQALAEQLWLRPLGNTMVIMPPLAISLEEIDILFAAVEKSLEREFGY
jgi:adenosylmethionine---8-amino-7-oxononanoate aminotransferase